MAVPQAKEKLCHTVLSPLLHLCPVPSAPTGPSTFLRGTRIRLYQLNSTAYKCSLCNDVVMEALDHCVSQDVHLSCRRERSGSRGKIYGCVPYHSKAHLATSTASVKSGGRRYIECGTATRAPGGPAGDPAIWVPGSHKPYFHRRLTRPLVFRSSVV